MLTVERKSIVLEGLKQVSHSETNRYKKRAFENSYYQIHKMTNKELMSRESFLDIYGIGSSVNEEILSLRDKGFSKRLGINIELPKSQYGEELYKVRKTYTTRRIYISDAYQHVNTLRGIADNLGIKFKTAGSLRRRKTLIADIDLVVYGCTEDQYHDFLDILSIKYPTISRGGYKASFMIDDVNNVQVDCIYSTGDQLPFQLLYLTGSAEFNIRMRARAKSMGYILNQNGLFRRDTNERIEGLITEKSIFGYLGMEYVEPWDR